MGALRCTSSCLAITARLQTSTKRPRKIWPLPRVSVWRTETFFIPKWYIYLLLTHFSFCAAQAKKQMDKVLKELETMKSKFYIVLRG